MSSPPTKEESLEPSYETMLRQVYASRPHVLQPGERPRWDQNMVYYAASRLRAACLHFVASEGFGEEYDEWWMSRIEGELREGLLALGAAGSYGSRIVVPRLIRELQKVLNNRGPLQFGDNRYWRVILACRDNDPSDIVGKYENAWWADAWNPDAHFLPWWAEEETRYNTGWVPVDGERYHLYTWELQVQSPCAPCGSELTEIDWPQLEGHSCSPRSWKGGTTGRNVCLQGHASCISSGRPGGTGAKRRGSGQCNGSCGTA